MPALQYTIRGIPKHVDQALRRRAKNLSKSFNQVLLDILSTAAGTEHVPNRDFSEVIGSLTDSEAHHLDDEIARQRQIDVEMWK